MNAFTKNIALAALIAGAVILSGCTPATAPEVEPTSTAIETPATVAPVENDSATPADAVTGTIVDEKTAEAINADFYEPMRQDVAVKLSNGDHVVVKAGEPLPQVVKDSVTNDIKTAVPDYSTTTTDAGSRALHAMQTEMEAATGRKVAPVSLAMTYVEGGTHRQGWFVGEPASALLGEYPSKDAAIAAVEGWVAQNPATRAYIVIE